MFKYCHGNITIPVSQLFRFNNEYPYYNTKNIRYIHAAKWATKACHRTFGYQFGIYRELPKNVG